MCLRPAYRRLFLFKARWNMRAFSSLLLLGLPLGVVAFMNSFNANVSRYFLEYHYGERELGIFAALGYLMIAGGQIAVALGQSASPQLAKYHAEGDTAAFRGMLLKLLGLNALLGLVGIVAASVLGRMVLTVLYNSDYAEYQDIFVILMVAGGFNYLTTALGCAAMAKRLTLLQPVALGVVIIVSALSSWAWIPQYGLTGSAWSVAAGSGTCTLCYIILLYRRNR